MESINQQFIQFRVLVERDEDGVFVASVPSLPGCHTQGKTYEEVMGRIKEAVELYLEVLKEKNKLDSAISEKLSSFFAIEDLAVKV